MKLLSKILIFFLICFGCNIISIYLPFPFPGSVLSMIVLFLCLTFGAIKLKHIDDVADFFLENMAFFFIPPTVSIISYVDVLKNIWWQFLIICVVTTVITFVATAYSVKLTIYIMNKRKGAKKND